MRTLSCIYLLAFVLLIVGCNDSAIPQAEFEVPDKDQLELDQPSENPEPPELVAAYTELWREIESERDETGVLDSAKVLLANQLALELAKYDGPMSTLLEILEAQAAGKSKEELNEILMRHNHSSFEVQETNDPCRERCRRRMEVAKERANEDLWNDLGECVGYAVISGVGGALIGGPQGAIALAGAAAIWCGYSAVVDQNEAIERAEEDHRLCIELECRPAGNIRL